MKRLLLASAWLPLLACGPGSQTSDSGPPPDSGNVQRDSGTVDSGVPDAGARDSGTSDAGFQTAPHDLPPPVTRHPGSILSSFGLVTMTYPAYVYTSQVQGWGDDVVTSSWLNTVGSEYGTRTGTHLAKIILPDPVPGSLTDSQIQQNIQRYIASNVVPPPQPANGNQVIYMLYVDPSTGITDDAGLGTLCQDFVGYHSDFGYDGGDFIYYAVVGDCPGNDAGDVESTAAHELIETATDPNNGWYLDVPNTDNWAALQFSEVGDLCEFLPNVTEGNFTFQRIWSNNAAADGGEPCVPIPASETAYWNVTSSPNIAQAVPPGQSEVITITGWSTAPVPDFPWSVSAIPGNDFDPTFTTNGGTLNNGQSATFTLTVPPGTGSGKVGGVMVWVDANQDYGWPVTITTP